MEQSNQQAILIKKSKPNLFYIYGIIKSMIKKYLPLLLLAVFVIIQFFQIDRTNPAVDASKDLFAVVSANENMKNRVISSCYECHSHTAKYPWYTYINPVGWWVKGHVNEGVSKLNFSEWTAYETSKQKHKLEECAERTEATEMPLLPYILAHSEAKMTKDERAKLVAWFNSKAK